MDFGSIIIANDFWQAMSAASKSGAAAIRRASALSRSVTLPDAVTMQTG
jgi:hypothetical protein